MRQGGRVRARELDLRPSRRALRAVVGAFVLSALASAPAAFAVEPPPLPHSDGGSPDAGVGWESLRGEASITGLVLERGRNVPIAFARVEVLDGGPAVEADVAGRFTLLVRPGEVRLELSASGYERRTFVEDLADEQHLDVGYRLDRRGAPFETTVRAHRTAWEPREALSATEAHEAAGTLGDPFRAVMLVPGVSAIASGLSYPVIRGTQPAATGFFLDGVRLPQLFHLVVGSAVVHPELIDTVDVFSGALPPAYGRLLGGAIEGHLARPPETPHATVSVDVLNASGLVSVPLDGAGLSVTLAGRWSYTPFVGAAVARALFPSTPEAPRPLPVANLSDAQARVEWRLGSGRLRLLALASGDEAGQRAAGEGTTTALLTSSFQRVDLSWFGPVGPFAAQLGLTAGADAVGLVGEQDSRRVGQFALARRDLVAHARFSRVAPDGLGVDFGFEADALSSSLEIARAATGTGGPAASFRAPATSGALADAFVELSRSLGRLHLSGGARADLYFLAPGTWLWSADPRAVARFAVSERLGLRAAAGLAHQQPTVLVNLPVSDLAGLTQGLQSAAHFELGVDALPVPGVEVAVTGYVAPIFRSVELSLESFLSNRPPVEGADLGLPGRSYGLEVLVRKQPSGRWFGWVSGTLQRAERLRTVAVLDGLGNVTGTERRWVAFAFDQAVVLHAVAGVRLGRGYSLGAGVHFNTGRPESGVLSSRAMRPGLEPGTAAPTWVPVPLADEVRLPPFWRLDVRASKTWVFDAFTLELYLDVLDASLGAEVLAYDYRTTGGLTDRALTKTPVAIPLVLPFLGLKGSY